VESDPWHGDTLEWTVPSPPPAYNFARIPTVTSLHPAWEPSGQPASAEPLVAGHLTIESSPLEGRDEAVLEMPDSSLLPICFAAAALLASTGTLLRWWWLAALGAAVMIAALIAWQWHNLAERRDPTVTESVGSLPVGRSPAWWGMGLLIATEAMLFAILLVSYLFLRYSATPSWPPPGIDVPTLPLPLVMTALLIASSVPMHLAVRRARKHETGAARIYLAATLVLGTAFLALQAFEYSDKLQHFGPRKNAYASMFYITTSFHALHLVAGMALVVWAMTAIGKPTSLAVSTVENVGFYWHFVDAVWIAVFATLYLTVAL
jgi:heme/copper-type cytochrome/quinol oxidase subunit 3